MILTQVLEICNRFAETFLRKLNKFQPDQNFQYKGGRILEENRGSEAVATATT